ncbi:hypothetical protein [Marinobacterium aestuariivivens]|uniref:Type 4 fimbrial biogenesis protein PilX N-terminal domain-containing protein n=1 Tax=Marinobacterium aestuariivivens TaxID=1698799 RepID=A0ABW2A4A2_9GAMM
MQLNSTRLSHKRPARLMFVLLIGTAVTTLLIIWAALQVQAATRAFIRGENLWTHSFQNAVFYADRYAEAGDPVDLRLALGALSGPSATARHAWPWSVRPRSGRGPTRTACKRQQPQGCGTDHPGLSFPLRRPLCGRRDRQLAQR